MKESLVLQALQSVQVSTHGCSDPWFREGQSRETPELQAILLGSVVDIALRFSADGSPQGHCTGLYPSQNWHPFPRTMNLQCLALENRIREPSLTA